MAQLSNRKTGLRLISSDMIVCRFNRVLSEPETVTSDNQINRSEEI